jgi:cardiolipin synthase A/B
MSLDPASLRDPVNQTLAVHPTLTDPIIVAAQELLLFVEAPPLIEALLADIRAARTRIWVETYIFLNDMAGHVIADALMEQARAGLDVRVLYDALGSVSTPAVFFRRMQRAGVQVHTFHSWWEALWRFSPVSIINRRDHRKLIVIDDRVAYFGGMNIVDPKSASAGGRGRVHVALGWRDIHVRLRGSRQAELAESFERSWRRAHHLPVRRRPRSYRLARLAPGEESIQFFDCGHGPRYTRAWRVFSQVLRQTRHTLMLSMAYFLPYGRLLRDFLRAHRRGVFVRVVVPGESDVPIVQRATRHLYRILLRRRFHIFERQRNMLHSKVLVADDAWSIIGSCNLDARSLRMNLEFLAVIHSPRLAQILSDIIRYEAAHSRRMTVRECRQWTWWQRFKDRTAWALRWWL